MKQKRVLVHFLKKSKSNIVFFKIILLKHVLPQNTTFTKEAEVSDNGKYVRCKAENMVNEGVDDKGGFSLQLMLKIGEKASKNY